MTALLATVERGGDEIADRLLEGGERHITLVGGPGTGKAAALRHANHALAARGVTSICLEAGNDDLTPIALLHGLSAGLNGAGYSLSATDDAFRDPWSDQLASCSSALSKAGADGAVVLLSGVESLEHRASLGGTPGRHAAEVIALVERTSPKLALARTASGDTSRRTVTIDGADLAPWLEDASVWGSLAPAAGAVAREGQAWTALPALTVRLAVALSQLGVLPSSPPATPLQAARVLAPALAEGRTTRAVWAVWQLVAQLRGPLKQEALIALVEDLPGDVLDDDILTRCLLFWHDGWHLHPSLRLAAREVTTRRPELALPRSKIQLSGERMANYFRDDMVRLANNGEIQASDAARSAALDACAMAEDETLAESLVEQLPDPYDHIGRIAARAPTHSREAFVRARSIDQRDATALRGLADVEDRRAVDANAAETLFREAIGLEPAAPDTHVRLIGLLLAAGRPMAADRAFGESVAVLAGPLEEPELTEQFFVPTARVALAAGRLSLASRAADAARSALGDSATVELARLVDGLIEALEYGQFVAPQRLGTSWWQRPTLLADYDAGAPLNRWLAARVESVELDVALVHYADIVDVVDGGRPERAWTSIGVDELHRLSVDHLPDGLPGEILEIGIYGDADLEGTTVVRLVAGSDHELPSAALPLDRFVRHTPT